MSLVPGLPAVKHLQPHQNRLNHGAADELNLIIPSGPVVVRARAVG